MLNCEDEFSICILNNLNLVQSIDDVMGAEFVDLFTLVRRANGDDSSARRYSGFDTTGGVLEDHRPFWVDPEVRRGEEKRIREGLATLETYIVGSHADFRDSNTAVRWFSK
jgi:hypothetical protein